MHFTEEGLSHKARKRPKDEEVACSNTLFKIWTPITEDKMHKYKIVPDSLMFPKIRPSDGITVVGIIMKHCAHANILNFWVKEAV